MAFQKSWAECILTCNRRDLNFLILKCIAVLFYYRQCFHFPFFGTLDLAPDLNKPVFIYTSFHNLQRLMYNRCNAVFGTETILATTIPPYCWCLSRWEVSHLHNSAFPETGILQSDAECFIAILLSTLFSAGEPQKITMRDGKEVDCLFFKRFGTDPRPYDVLAFGYTLFSNGVHAVRGPKSLPPCIDLLYDYHDFLRRSEACGRVGCYPVGKRLSAVAISGGGLAAHVAAFELLRAGVKNVTLFEPCDQVGRKRKLSPMCACQKVEARALRFPESQTCLFHYLNKFKIVGQAPFPTLGAVDTALYFEDAVYIWQGGRPPPEKFRSVYQGWQGLLLEGCDYKGKKLLPPLAITSMLKAHRFAEACLAWQDWLDAFGDLSFGSALEIIFTSNMPPGGYQWRKPEDFQLFDVLGNGSGCGLSYLEQAGFAEIMRSIINGYQDDQRLIPGGISTLLVQLRNQTFRNRKLSQHLCIDGVDHIRKTKKKIEVRLSSGKSRAFNRAIFATCPQNMQSSYGLMPDINFFSDDVVQATKEVLHTGASKLFIITESKFWIKGKLPILVRGNGRIREACCLDYDPENAGGHGIVLITYNWRAPFCEQLEVTEKRQLCEALAKELANILPDFVVHLVPLAGDYDRHVLCDESLGAPYDADGSKLNAPGRDISTKRLFFQFLDANCKEKDKGLYLAGSDCSFSGAWAEGAVQTALNAVCAVIRSTGGRLLLNNPMDALRCEYRY